MGLDDRPDRAGEGRTAGSGLDRQVRPIAPFVPRAVAVGHVGVAQPGEVEEDDGGGDAAQARRHWQQALDLYAGLGVPEADQAREALEAGAWSVPSAL